MSFGVRSISAIIDQGIRLLSSDRHSKLESDFVEVDCNATSTMLSTTNATTEKRISSSSTTSSPKVLPQISPNCKVAGEGKSNNPEYCYAIYEEKVLGNDGVELDCCWTANVESKLPKHLEGIAKIYENNTMYDNLKM